MGPLLETKFHVPSRQVPSLRGFEGKWIAIRDGEVMEARESPYELVGPAT